MRRKSFRARVCLVLLVVFAAAFLFPAARTGNSRLYVLFVAVTCGMLLLLLLPAGIFTLDRPLIAAAILLCGFGIMAPVLVSPDEAVSQGLHCIPALFFLLAGCIMVRSFRFSWASAAIAGVCSLGVLSVPLIFSQLPFSLTEGGTVLMLFALSSFLALRLRLPALFFTLCALALILIRQDANGAIIWALTGVLLFWAASDSLLWSVISLILCGGFTAAFFILFCGNLPVAHDSVLQRFASMPLVVAEWPVKTASAPADSLFILLGEQFGFILLFCALSLLCMLLIRAASVSLHTRKVFHASLALGALLLIGLKGLLFMLSLTDILPLPRGSFPLMSVSVSELCAEFFMLGIISGVSTRNDADLTEDARISILAH